MDLQGRSGGRGRPEPLSSCTASLPKTVTDPKATKATCTPRGTSICAEGLMQAQTSQLGQLVWLCPSK